MAVKNNKLVIIKPQIDQFFPNYVSPLQHLVRGTSASIDLLTDFLPDTSNANYAAYF
jgi:hypothetical protein